MAEVSCLLLGLLLTASLCLAQDLAKPELIEGEDGKEVTFHLRYSGPRTEVVWKIGEDKLVEVDGSEAIYYRLKERASVSLNPGDLKIHRLVVSDRGNYRGSYLQDGKYHETEFTLTVSPSKPQVNYTENNQNKKVRLYCNSNSTGVTYEWRNSSGGFLSSEPNPEIHKEKVRNNESLMCIVRNNHADINNTLIYIPTPDPPIPVWIIVIGILLPIVLVIVGGVVIYKKRQLLCKMCKGNKQVSGDNRDKEGEPLNSPGDPAENGKTPGKAEGE